MAMKDLKLDSIVVNNNYEVLTSIKVNLTYADYTKRQSQFSTGDIISVKFVRDKHLVSQTGKVTKIKIVSSTISETYFCMDISAQYQTYVEKIYISELRDISNITNPSYDINFDKDGNIVPTEPIILPEKSLVEEEPKVSTTEKLVTDIKNDIIPEKDK